MPLLKLRRENVGNFTKSWFQNILCDILYDPGQAVLKISPDFSDALKNLNDHQNSILNQVFLFKYLLLEKNKRKMIQIK